jgi:hypothetical protein
MKKIFSYLDNDIENGELSEDSDEPSRTSINNLQQKDAEQSNNPNDQLQGKLLPEQTNPELSTDESVELSRYASLVDFISPTKNLTVSVRIHQEIHSIGQKKVKRCRS